MRVIVSNYLKDNFKGYTVVGTFKEIRALQDVQCLIIHRYTESDFEAGMFLSEFHKNGIHNFVYISANPSTTLKMMLNGMNGTILEDEFYFDDEEELNAVLEDIGLEDTSETELISSNASIISDFIKAFANGDEKIKSPVYIEQVNNALTELTEMTNQQQLLIKDMGTTAVSTFERASSLISSMAEQRRLLQKQLDELEETHNSSISNSPRNKFGGGGISFFPSFKYVGSAKVLLVRELSPCRYLTSFLLGYNHHVHFELNKRVKLIFIHQKGAGVSAKYSGICTSITQESMQDDSLYDAPIVATNNPKQEVLKELTHKNDEVIIVVDRLYGSQDIMNTRVVKINAVSGCTDLNRFKVQPKDCIFSTSAHPQNLLCIPHIKNYPADADTRYAIYSRTCKDNYIILDKLLQLC